MHDVQLADVLVDAVIEEFGRQVERLGKDLAQQPGKPVKFVPIGL